MKNVNNQEYYLDAYTILGVSKTASRDEIRKRYHILVKKYHPDKHENESPEVKNGYTEQFKQVGEAWSILGDNESRAKYDIAQQKLQDDEARQKRNDEERKKRHEEAKKRQAIRQQQAALAEQARREAEIREKARLAAEEAKRKVNAKIAAEQAKQDAEIKEKARLATEKSRLEFQAALNAQKAREAARKKMEKVAFTVIGIVIVSIFVFISKDTKEPTKHANIELNEDAPKNEKLVKQEIKDAIIYQKEPIRHANVKFEKDIPKKIQFAIQELADTINFGTEDEIKSLTNGGISGPNGFTGYGDLSSHGPLNFIAEKVKLTDGNKITTSPHSFILRKQNDTALSCDFYTINNRVHLKNCLWFEMFMQEDEGSLFAN